MLHLACASTEARITGDLPEAATTQAVIAWVERSDRVPPPITLAMVRETRHRFECRRRQRSVRPGGDPAECGNHQGSRHAPAG